MPPLPDVPSMLKYRLDWRSLGDATANTIHYFKYSGGPPSPTDLAAMAGTAVSSASTHFGPLMSVDSGMDGAMITDLTGPGYAQATGGTAWSGTSSGSPLSPGTAALVNHQIARRYRGGKPRSYLPIGIPADIGTNGLWNSAFITACDSAWGSWVADVLASGSGCTLVNIMNVGYFSGFTVVTSPTTGRSRNVPKMLATPHQDIIQAHSTAQKIGSQRRRNKNA